mgnify:CR=1 FL=1
MYWSSRGGVVDWWSSWNQVTHMMATSSSVTHSWILNCIKSPSLLPHKEHNNSPKALKYSSEEIISKLSSFSRRFWISISSLSRRGKLKHLSIELTNEPTKIRVSLWCLHQGVVWISEAAAGEEAQIVEEVEVIIEAEAPNQCWGRDLNFEFLILMKKMNEISMLFK